jgi:hypothetical protein
LGNSVNFKSQDLYKSGLGLGYDNIKLFNRNNLKARSLLQKSSVTALPVEGKAPKCTETAAPAIGKIVQGKGTTSLAKEQLLQLPNFAS